MSIKLSDLYVIMVTYNTSCQDSLTYKNLKTINGLNLIVCDNSTNVAIKKENEKLSQSDNFKYIDMGGNKGLSKAYNKAIGYIEKSPDKFICLFDDDTSINEEYFNKLLNNLNKNHADIYLPIVLSLERIMSPCLLKKDRCIEVKSLDQLKGTLSGINSGMVINASVYQDYKYNENLFLDYIDHDFMRSMNEKKKKVFVMYDIVIHQNFSMESNDVDSSYKRMMILKHDFKEFYKDNKLMYFYILTMYKYVMIKKYKKLKFLFIKNIKL